MMEREHEQKRAMEAKIREACPGAGAIGGQALHYGATQEATAGYPRDWRPTLRDRLKKTIESATQEQSRARKANELFDLLEKNPEIARILELVEELQY